MIDARSHGSVCVSMVKYGCQPHSHSNNTPMATTFQSHYTCMCVWYRVSCIIQPSPYYINMQLLYLTDTYRVNTGLAN